MLLAGYNTVRLKGVYEYLETVLCIRRLYLNENKLVCSLIITMCEVIIHKILEVDNCFSAGFIKTTKLIDNSQQT